MNRKRQLLAILVLILIGSVVYSVVRFPRQERVAGPPAARTTPRTPPPAAPGPAKKVGEVASAVPTDERLHLELLNTEPRHATGYRRNLFTPVFRDEVKPPPFRPLPPPKALPLPPPPPPQPVQAQPQGQPLPPEPPPAPPMPKFTFLGFLKKGGHQTVFLSSDKEIYLVKQGSIIAGNYEVTSLTDDAITIASRSGGGEVVIPLSENRSPASRAGRNGP